MSVEVHAVQAIRVYQEATFGADASASIGSFTYLPIREGSAKLELTRDSLDPGQLVQHIDEYRKEVLGKRSAKLTFTLNLAPTGVAAGSTIVAVTGPVGLLLKLSIGGEQLGTGTTFVTGSTATVPIVTSAAGLVGGGAIGWVNASGVLEVREIKSISGANVTLAHAFSGAPANGNVCYAAASYFPTANPANSMQFLVEGLETNDRWLVGGAQAVGGFTIALDPGAGQIPSISFSMQAAIWWDPTETGSSITGTLATATYSNYNPIVGEAGDFRVFTSGSPTLLTTTQVHASAIAFSPALKYAPYTAPDGKNTVKRWVRARSAPSVSGSFTLPYEDTTWWAARNSAATYNVAYQYGTAAGSAVLLSARACQMMNPQRQPDAAQLAAQMISWKGRRNIDTALTTDQATAPYAIHLA